MSSEEKQPQTFEEPGLSGTYTAADYLTWQMDELVELIRGKIYKMTPAPSSFHQQISTELMRQMLPHFTGNPCLLFHAPFDVYLVHPGENFKSAASIVEPDLCVICNAAKIKKMGCVGAPDLIIEILSPSTSQKDQKDTFELYEEFGVREYWIVSPENRSVMLNLLDEDKFKTYRPLTEGEVLCSHIFPELQVRLEDIFKGTGTETGSVQCP